MSTTPEHVLPQPFIIKPNEAQLDALLDKEWLLTNQLGAYAGSSVLGCNTRRYHSLLIASMLPPVERVATLATIMEHLHVGRETFSLATNEFADTFSPRGYQHIAEFRMGVIPSWRYQAGGVELLKEIVLAEDSNTVSVRYTLTGGRCVLQLWPFAAMRDFHHLRKVHQPHQMLFETAEGGITIEDRHQAISPLGIVCPGNFDPAPQWWYKFCYRGELSRGMEGFEDLYTPGCFEVELTDGQSCQLTAWMGNQATVDFDATVARRKDRMIELAGAMGDTDEPTRRLAISADAFVVKRQFKSEPSKATILAGYHWFADWGRDAFIALPGLLLSTRRFDLARQVFTTFASSISKGMIPNRFDDYGGPPHYNSIDASLWFIIAADRYVEATDDMDFWTSTLAPAAMKILQSYHEGTRFDIRADDDQLLTGGSPKTQLTWMDAKLGDEAITPRHGKAVEINALWHCAHRIMARRCSGLDAAQASFYALRASAIASAFVQAFWNPSGKHLYDCITNEVGDPSIRPNQILAISLPHSPLDTVQQKDVLEVVKQHLLTPMGLRTLSPVDSRYRRKCAGSWEGRDRAYHQGTVWAWLMGPYIEAMVRANGYASESLQAAQDLLKPLDQHLNEAALGFVSEIFDGDPPHAPRGCVAQAWSVAELLRVKLMLQRRRGR